MLGIAIATIEADENDPPVEAAAFAIAYEDMFKKFFMSNGSFLNI